VAVGDSPKIVEDEAMKKYPNVIPSVMQCQVSILLQL